MTTGKFTCDLVVYDSNRPSNKVHCLIGTAKEMGKYLNGLNLEPHLVIFDDANKSLSWRSEGHLLEFEAQYMCVTSFISNNVLDICDMKLNAMKSMCRPEDILSTNLRHLVFYYKDQSEKLSATKKICGWQNADQIVIFVLVSVI